MFTLGSMKPEEISNYNCACFLFCFVFSTKVTVNDHLFCVVGFIEIAILGKYKLYSIFHWRKVP